VPSVTKDLTLYGEAQRCLDMVNEYAPYWTRGPLAGVFAQTK
jgi:hypothetical protein